MMVSGILDTTILVHLFRGSKEATAWLATQDLLDVTSISRLEFIYGARGRRALAAIVKLPLAPPRHSRSLRRALS